MIKCYKCGKELQEVYEIGEIVRSCDGADFCFCQNCKDELEREDEAIRASFDVDTVAPF